MRHIIPFLAVLTLVLAADAAEPPKPVANDADINPAAWEFLRAVDAGEAAEAYQRTTHAYRGDHPLQMFTEEMERLRGDVDLKQIRRLQIFASAPPADER